jgi:hypothetical protein
MTKDINPEMTPQEIRVAIENKEKAHSDLANWLAGRSNESDEFKMVLKDKKLLEEEIGQLKAMLAKIEKEVEEHLGRGKHTSFEL